MRFVASILGIWEPRSRTNPHCSQTLRGPVLWYILCLADPDATVQEKGEYGVTYTEWSNDPDQGYHNKLPKTESPTLGPTKLLKRFARLIEGGS